MGLCGLRMCFVEWFSQRILFAFFNTKHKQGNTPSLPLSFPLSHPDPAPGCPLPSLQAQVTVGTHWACPSETIEGSRGSPSSRRLDGDLSSGTRRRELSTSPSGASLPHQGPAPTCIGLHPTTRWLQQERAALGPNRSTEVPQFPYLYNRGIIASASFRSS